MESNFLRHDFEERDPGAVFFCPKGAHQTQCDGLRSMPRIAVSLFCLAVHDESKGGYKKVLRKVFFRHSRKRFEIKPGRE